MKRNITGLGLTVDLSLLTSDAGGSASQRGFRAFKARGASLKGLVGAHEMFVGALLHRDGAFVQAPGTLLESAFSLVQVLLALVDAGPRVGHLFPTVGKVFALISEAIALVGGITVVVGRFRANLPGAAWKSILSAGGSHWPMLTTEPGWYPEQRTVRVSAGLGLRRDG